MRVHRIETDEAGVEVAVTGTDLTDMQVAATLAHKWVYGYSLPQPGASGVCKTPGPDAIEVNGFPLAVHGFQQQVKVRLISDLHLIHSTKQCLGSVFSTRWSRLEHAVKGKMYTNSTLRYVTTGSI